MSNIGRVTSNVGPELRTLQDDELDAVNGGKKTSAADRARAYDKFVRDNVVTSDELVSLHEMS
jgi:hypothetical protein